MKIAEKFIHHYPNLSSGYALRALINFDQINYELASSDYKKALELNSSCGLAMIVKGKLLMKKRKWNEALKMLRDGIRIEKQWRILVTRDIEECRSKINM